MLGIAVAYLLFAFAITLTWYIEPLGRFVPVWLSDWMYPIDKTNLDVLRFAHFLALAAVTVRFVPRDWPALKSPFLAPAILCGQHSLEIFCLGVFLAFAGQFIISEWSGGPLDPDRYQLGRHPDHDCDSEPDIVVQAYGRARRHSAGQTAGRRPRGGRGMKLAIAVIATLAPLAACLAGVARAAPPEQCDVPQSLHRQRYRSQPRA